MKKEDYAAVLNALPNAVCVFDAKNNFLFLNSMAESLFQSSLGYLKGKPLKMFLPEDSPVFDVIDQVRKEYAVILEHDILLDTPRIGQKMVTLRAAPMVDLRGAVLLAFDESSMARKIGQHMSHQKVARSVTAMAGLLAHEVKNPISGIRGAAQLLEMAVPEQDKQLTRLICDETDRIVALVDRIEIFSDNRPLQREPVNIHRVLEHVRMLSENGFGKHIHFVEQYDPSLPAVNGNKDQLIQVFLNLVKNAAEAVSTTSGRITLRTSYRHGVRMAVPGTQSTMDLPLIVSVIDNGEGIPEQLQDHLFDPFVTTKNKGSGLGLALVAKLVQDHGGIIEFESEPGHTEFTIMLPITHHSEHIA
jgi:two-component system nitrogen regulation sensor histidine kinase GlnL